MPEDTIDVDCTGSLTWEELLAKSQWMPWPSPFLGSCEALRGLASAWDCNLASLRAVPSEFLLNGEVQMYGSKGLGPQHEKRELALFTVLCHGTSLRREVPGLISLGF